MAPGPESVSAGGAGMDRRAAAAEHRLINDRHPVIGTARLSRAISGGGSQKRARVALVALWMDACRCQDHKRSAPAEHTAALGRLGGVRGTGHRLLEVVPVNAPRRLV